MSEYRAALARLAGDGIRARTVSGINGLTMQLLEAGSATERRPLLLLLHGFPELAYSWRRVMPALAAAGYYVVAPDQRGYGGTTAGTPPTTATWPHSACSTWCATRWGWWMRWATTGRRR